MLINPEQLDASEINTYLHKVRAIMFDQNGRILVTDMRGSYNLPGGRVEENESIEDTLIREVKEETGVEVALEDAELIGNYHFYHRDFPGGANRDNEIDLYAITKPVVYNSESASITEYEKDQDFRILLLSREELAYLMNQPSDNNYKKFTNLELQVLIDEYVKSRGGKENARKEI
jgi:8-oxo-dGTP pyrophosphatase MutT (NUDIX family)